MEAKEAMGHSDRHVITTSVPSNQNIKPRFTPLFKTVTALEM